MSSLMSNTKGNTNSVRFRTPDLEIPDFVTD